MRLSPRFVHATRQVNSEIIDELVPRSWGRRKFRDSDCKFERALIGVKGVRAGLEELEDSKTYRRGGTGPTPLSPVAPLETRPLFRPHT